MHEFDLAGERLLASNLDLQGIRLEERATFAALFLVSDVEGDRDRQRDLLIRPIVVPPCADELEGARQCVDRIAFCGQVPVNVTGDFAVGDYIIAVANGSGIKGVAVAEVDITFDQYRRRIGKVWAVRDGRAWVDVQHG